MVGLEGFSVRLLLSGASNMGRYLWTAGLALVVGLGVGYRLSPTQTVTKTVEKVIEKRNIVTVTKTAPDGSVIVEVTDKSIIDSDKSSSKSTKKDNLNWLLSAGYLRGLQGEPQSEIIGSLQRRILGEIYIGVIGSNKGMLGLGATIRF